MILLFMICLLLAPAPSPSAKTKGVYHHVWLLFFIFSNVHYSLSFCPVCSDFVICILFITLIFGTSALNYFAFHQAFFYPINKKYLHPDHCFPFPSPSSPPSLSVSPFIKLFNGPLVLRQDQQWTYDPLTLSFVMTSLFYIFNMNT